MSKKKSISRPPGWFYFTSPGPQETIFYLRVALPTFRPNCATLQLYLLTPTPRWVAEVETREQLKNGSLFVVVSEGVGVRAGGGVGRVWYAPRVRGREGGGVERATSYTRSISFLISLIVVLLLGKAKRFFLQQLYFKNVDEDFSTNQLNLPNSTIKNDTLALCLI